jgi:hypothetical protein
LHAFEQSLEERRDRFAGAVALARKRQPHREHAARIESRIDLLQLGKAPDQQAGAEQQQNGEGNLGDDEHLADATAAGGVADARLRFQ